MQCKGIGTPLTWKEMNEMKTCGITRVTLNCDSMIKQGIDYILVEWWRFV